MTWPNKQGRETFELAGFIGAYARLPGGRSFTVVSRGDKPDAVVRDTASGEEFGIELTSVYSDDRSVPDLHIPGSEGASSSTDIPFSKKAISAYQERLLSAIRNKVTKASRGYDLSRPLVLSIYVNEYISINLAQSELETMVATNEALFDAMEPFSEVVFWNLGNGGVLRVCPGK